MKRKQIRYLNVFDIINILKLLSPDAKWAILLRLPSLVKVEVHNFSLLHFLRWFCLVNGQLAMSLRCVKRSVICKFHVSVCSIFNFSFSPSQNVFVLIFYQNAKTITVLYIYSKSQSLPKNVPYWRQQTDVSRCHFWAYF